VPVIRLTIQLHETLFREKQNLYRELERLYLGPHPIFCLVFPFERLRQVNEAFDLIILRHGLKDGKVFDYELISAEPQSVSSLLEETDKTLIL